MNRGRKSVVIVAAGLGVFPQAGCYYYRATDVGQLRVGQRARIELSPAGAADLASSIGPNATIIDGRVLTAGDSGITLAVTQIARTVGPEEFLKDESLTIPRGGASTFQVRELDRERTVLAIGSIIAAAFVARKATTEAPLGGSGSGTPVTH